MKTNIVLLFSTLLILSACASTPETAPVDETPAPVAAKETPADKGQLGAVSATGGLTETEQTQAASRLQGKSVYFDFDQFNIKSEYQDVVQQQANLAKTNASILVLEGNADERGSSEYNLALGNKRAYAVRKALEVMGVQGSRIEVVSFGEEKPRATCHEEKCWSENRRVDFNVKPGKP